MLFKALTIAAAVGSVVAQRPNGTSICDYYTTALLKNNTAANQKTVLTLVVNTAVIGNYTPMLNKGVKVAGILTAGEYNGTSVNLLPYFDGGFASTNENGMAKSVNFLDGGAATPLMNNTAANDMSSAQYTLITHLYEYFGALLGCSMMGGPDFPEYSGVASMYEVHKYMDLSAAEVGYFIEQVGLSAKSFGVADEDVAAVGKALNSVFNNKCGAPATVVPSQGPVLESICIGDGCPMAANATCNAYNGTMPTMPAVAVSSLVPSSSKATGTPTAAGAATTGTMTASSSASTPTKSSGASHQVAGGFVAAAGLAAMLL